MAWQWEGDWQIETTLDGQPLDHDVNIIFLMLIKPALHFFFILFQNLTRFIYTYTCHIYVMNMRVIVTSKREVTLDYAISTVQVNSRLQF